MLQNASWFVTDRLDGDSQEAFAFNNLAGHVGDDPAHVAANRAALAVHVGHPVVFTRAGHSARCHYVDAVVPDVPGVDALITDVPGLAVAAQGADCAIIAIAAGQWVAAVHCGWKGLVSGVVAATLEALSQRGADLRAASAHVGPAICGHCYTVDEHRAAQVWAVVPQAVVENAGGPGVDGRAGVAAQLAAHGIVATVDPRCTFEDPDLYSFRRDGRTGRQAIVIVREAA